jgi:hypothetical protein
MDLHHFDAVGKFSKNIGANQLRWHVLDWNTPAIEFYKSLGTVLMDEWTMCRLSGPPLAALARETR